jgi:hypothetical protein
MNYLVRLLHQIVALTDGHNTEYHPLRRTLISVIKHLWLSDIDTISADIF